MSALPLFESLCSSSFMVVLALVGCSCMEGREGVRERGREGGREGRPRSERGQCGQQDTDAVVPTLKNGVLWGKGTRLDDG